MSVRYTKAEIAARKTAEQVLADPDASINAKYYARLIKRQTEDDARARAEKNEQRPDAPVIVHRVPVPQDPNAKAFLDALEAMLEHQDEAASPEASQPVAPAATVALRASESKPPTGDEICMLCLIPRGNCGHSGDQSNRGETRNE
jgi:hypothetical protein